MKTLKYILFTLVLSSGVVLRANNEQHKHSKVLAGAKIAGYGAMKTVNLCLAAFLGYVCWPKSKKNIEVSTIFGAYVSANLVWASKYFASNAIDQYKQAF